MSDSAGLGAGKDARFRFFEHSATLTGARFVIRCSPPEAISLAMQQLAVEGFVAREDNLDARLQEQGSPWVARAAEIGDAKGSWAKSLLADIAVDTPLAFFSRFRRGIAPTLVMAAARAAEGSATELVVYPHTSRRGDPEGWAGAAARLRATMNAIATTVSDNGTLVSYEQLTGIRNDGSPASQQMVRDLLGWR